MHDAVDAMKHTDQLRFTDGCGCNADLCQKSIVHRTGLRIGVKNQHRSLSMHQVEYDAVNVAHIVRIRKGSGIAAG